MDYEDWQLKRRELAEIEKKERQVNWQQARAPLQAAVTEQAVRELYRRVETLEQWMLDDTKEKLGEPVKRGPGRPRKQPEA